MDESCKYELIVDNNAYRIKVQRLSKDKVLVDFGDKKIIAKVKKVREDGHTLIEIDDKIYNIVVNNLVQESNEAPKVEVNAAPLKVMVRERLNMNISSEEGPTPFVEYQKEKTTFIPLGAVVAPFHGKLVELKVKIGDKVKKGQTVAIIEAMKMRNEIVAKVDGIVRDIRAKIGKIVKKGEPLVTIK
ncbi:MAG: biotin/lipoyl-containing protein [Candidatus Asgardarchaeia archaeon]